MSEVEWYIQQGELPDEDGWVIEVTALLQQDAQSTIRVSVTERLNHQPGVLDAEYHKDEILEVLAEAGLYSGGNDE